MPAFDPDDGAAIGEALPASLVGRVGSLEVAEGPARYGAGMDTYVYAVRFAGDIPAEWAAPLILRVYPSPAQVAKAEREAAVQTFVAGLGFPAPRPLLLDTSGVPFGLPFMIMERLPGRPAVDLIKNPLAIRGVVRRMAVLQSRLHALPVDGCPLPYDAPLVDRLLAGSRELVERHQPAGAEAALAWLEEHASLVREEQPVLIHNDFHPLNILVDDGQMSLLDWSDAALGDRHCDVARTLALLWLAAPLLPSALARAVLGLLRRYIVPLYAREYGRLLPLDERRLRYWEAVHAFKSWLQVTVLLQEGETALQARPGVASEIPAGVLPAIQDYFQRRVAILSQAALASSV
jgi:aminoglycoside phosphotransferase (APT) family kinase protein